MNKVVMAYIGFLLIAMHFSSQVHAQNATTKSPAMTTTTKAGGGSSNMTKIPDVVATKNSTIPKGASAPLQSTAVILLIPIAAGSLLLGGF